MKFGTQGILGSLITNADHESEFKIQKLQMADPIWRQNTRNDLIWMKIGTLRTQR